MDNKLVDITLEREKHSNNIQLSDKYNSMVESFDKWFHETKNKINENVSTVLNINGKSEVIF